MANARQQRETRVTGVTLELSADEAYAVKFLCGKIHGLSRFKDAAVQVYRALEKAGVTSEVTLANPDFESIDGNSVTMPVDLTIKPRA